MKIKRVFALPSDERFYDIGTPDRLKELRRKVHDYFKNPFRISFLGGGTDLPSFYQRRRGHGHLDNRLINICILL